MPKLILVNNEKEEKDYLQHIHDNFDDSIKFSTFKKLDIKKIEKEWGKLDFFNIVEKIAKFKWKHKKYFAFISSNTKFSFASPFPEFENKVLIDFGCEKKLRIICHELLHQYLNQIIYYELKDEKFENEIIHELFVTHMLFDTELNELFKDNYTSKKDLFDAGHKKAFKLYGKSKKLWNSKKDIKDYLTKIIKIL